MSKKKLEQLENIFSDSHICEIQARFNELECSAEKCDDCPLSFGDGICLKNTFELKWKLQKENRELKQDVKDVMSDYQDAAKLMFKLDKVVEILSKVIILPEGDDFALVDKEGNTYYALSFTRKLLSDEEYKTVVKEFKDYKSKEMK